MLTVDQRAEAQERWKQSLGEIEAVTGLSLFVLLSGAGGAISRRIGKIIAESRRAPDPAGVLASRLPQVRAIIQQEMALIEDGAATAFADARRRGVSAGGIEGLARVAATGQPTRQIDLGDVLEEQQETATTIAREFVSGAARRAEQSSFAQLFRTLGVTADVLDVGFTLNQWANQSAAYGARNSAVAGGREGMWNAYGQNGQEGWVWIASPLACDFCLGMSGLVFPITSKQESHPNCQCSMEPVKSLDDPAVGFNPTAYFAGLPAETRRRILGKRRAQQFDAGELNLREIPVERGAPITGQQLLRDDRRPKAKIEQTHLEGYPEMQGPAGRAIPASAQDILYDQGRQGDRWVDWNTYKSDGNYGDPALREFGIAMDYGDAPTVYGDSQIDEFVAAGEVEIFRGVDEEQWAVDFVEGAYNPGRGVHGNGYYAGSTREITEPYVGASGVRQRMTIRSDANVVDLDEFVREQRLFPRTTELDVYMSMGRQTAGVDVLPYNGRRQHILDEFANALEGGHSADVKAASSLVDDKGRDLINAWEEAIGDEFWKIYKPNLPLGDQPLLVNVADPRFTFPGLRIPADLRLAAQEYVQARTSLKKLQRAADRAADETMRQFAKGVQKTEFAGIIAGIDAFRVPQPDGTFYYVILNRGAVRMSDTVDALEDTAQGLRFQPKKLFRSEEDALNDEIAEVVDQRVSKAEALSKTLDDEMQDIARELGAELDGLEFSVKGRGSMARKVRSKYNNAIAEGDPKTVREIVEEEIRDANRYTVILDTASYGDNLEEFVAAFRARGYSFPADYWKNTWRKTKTIRRDGVEIEVPNDYRGLNTTMRSPDGDFIEVQFHTKESFATKQVNHDLYEEAREEGVSAARKGELDAIQARNAAEIPDPQRWDEFLEPPTPAAGQYADGLLEPRQLISSFTGQRGNKKIAADTVDEVMDELEKLGIRLPRGLNQWNDQSPRFGVVEDGQLPIEYRSKIGGAVAYYENQNTGRGGAFATQAEMGSIGAKGSRIVIGAEMMAKLPTKEAKRASIGGTFVHEFGHFMDRELFGDASQTYATVRAKKGLDSPLSKWYDVVTKSDSYKRIEDGLEAMSSTVDGRRLAKPAQTQKYFLSAEELWARSMAQWFALRTDGSIYSVLDLRTDPANAFMRRVGLEPHWDEDDFEPIAEAIDEIMREMGWLV